MIHLLLIREGSKEAGFPRTKSLVPSAHGVCGDGSMSISQKLLIALWASVIVITAVVVR